MKRIFLILLLFCFSREAVAQVIVKSGEHDGFTRLVMNYGKKVDWLVGRVDDGYEIHIAGDRQNYDLSSTFDIIGKTRLASLGVVKETGHLRFNLACECHANAFEFRPGIVVIDLKDGRPPTNSPFERLFAYSPIMPKQEAMESTKASEYLTTSTHGENWKKSEFNKNDNPYFPSDIEQSHLYQNSMVNDFSETLLHQLSRSASRGLIDLKNGEEISTKARTPDLILESMAHSRNSGYTPDASNLSPDRNSPSLSFDGETCIPDEAFNFLQRQPDTEIWLQMARNNLGVVQEFDSVNAPVLKESIEFLLSIGFGAEARQLLTTYPASFADEHLWTALSYLVDGEDDPKDFFSEQASCDTAAAIWSVLDKNEHQGIFDLNSLSLFRAYSSFPLAMKSHLGPLLVDILIKNDKVLAAEKIRDILSRTQLRDTVQSTLADAAIDLNRHAPVDAEKKASAALSESGPETWSAIVTLVEAKAAQNLPVDKDTVLVLESLAEEFSGSAAENAIKRAIVLANGLSGNFTSAFSSLSDSPSADVDLWRILSERGTDDDILMFAVFSIDKELPKVAPDTAAAIATKLTHLGMAESALLWLKRFPNLGKVDLAKGFLEQGMAKEAISLVSQENSHEALSVKAEALQVLGQNGVAAEIFSNLGEFERQQYAIRRNRDWNAIPEDGQDLWADAVRFKNEIPEPISSGAGLLTSIQNSADKTNAANGAISALIADQKAK